MRGYRRIPLPPLCEVDWMRSTPPATAPPQPAPAKSSEILADSIDIFLGPVVAGPSLDSQSDFNNTFRFVGLGFVGL